MAFVTELVTLKKLPPASDILSVEEIKKYGSLNFEKRRIDWLGGRFCAKKAIASALNLRQTDYREIEISNDASRKPYFTVRGNNFPNILSISHCPDFGISAVGTGKNSLLGIDMEMVEERAASWAKQFFTPKELTCCHSPLRLTRLWTQKEAVLKALGLGLASNLHELSIIDNKPIFSGRLLELCKKNGSKEIRITSLNKEKHVISIAYDF
jgi:4'-phosphopantetheinyl transferase